MQMISISSLSKSAASSFSFLALTFNLFPCLNNEQNKYSDNKWDNWRNSHERALIDSDDNVFINEKAEELLFSSILKFLLMN